MVDTCLLQGDTVQGTIYITAPFTVQCTGALSADGTTKLLTVE